MAGDTSADNEAGGHGETLGAGSEFRVSECAVAVGDDATGGLSR